MTTTQRIYAQAAKPRTLRGGGRAGVLVQRRLVGL